MRSFPAVMRQTNSSCRRTQLQQLANFDKIEWAIHYMLQYCQIVRRGFTTRLQKLKSRAPISGGPKILGVRTICNIFVSNYICIFVLVQCTFFTMPLTKDLHRTAVPNRGFPDPWGRKHDFRGSEMRFSRVRGCMFLDILFPKEPRFM